MNGYLSQQGKKLLENSRHALLYAGILAVIPYTTFLSLAIISLVTLRKGWREGSLLLMPVMIMFLTSSMFLVPPKIAIFNTLLAFLPCYLAACVLGKTANWRSVAGVFFLFLLLTAVFFHVFLPEFIAVQFQYLSASMGQLNPDLLSKVLSSNSLNQIALANYLFGLQLVSLVISVIWPLTLARSVQSQLYYPGGYQQEMHSLRDNKVGLLMLVVLLLAVSQGKLIAMNMLPLVVMYFLCIGLSLGFHAFAGKKIRGASLILILPLIFMPFIMIPAYVILGSLDSLFNLRLYLPTSAGKTT